MYCCDNTCQDSPCEKDFDGINQFFRWCGYEKYCFNNIQSPKQLLMIDNNEECPPHQFGAELLMFYTEEEAVDWMSIDNECE